MGYLYLLPLYCSLICHTFGGRLSWLVAYCNLLTVDCEGIKRRLQIKEWTYDTCSANEKSRYSDRQRFAISALAADWRQLMECTQYVTRYVYIVPGGWYADYLYYCTWLENNETVLRAKAACIERRNSVRVLRVYESKSGGRENEVVGCCLEWERFMKQMGSKIGVKCWRSDGW